jgi:quercetin dioxygenase-like cupin family protein
VFEPDAESLMALLLDSLAAEEVAGDKVESRSPQSPRKEVRANLLAALDGSAAHPFPGFARRFARLFDISVEKSDEILGKMSSTSEEDWLPLGGTSLLHFEPGPRYEGAHAGLVRCQPGMDFPTHRHLGTETTMILAGGISDLDTGEVFLPGDVVTKPADTEHHLRILAPHECVFAVLMEGGFPDFD